MGSKFKHRKRKGEYGWLSKEVSLMQKKQNSDNYKLDMFFEVLGRFKEMTLYIAHDSFGMSRGRLISLDRRIDWLCEQNNTPIDMAKLKYYNTVEVGINPMEVVSRIPLQYKSQLLNELLPKHIIRGNTEDNYRIINELFEMYFTFLITALEYRKTTKNGGTYRMMKKERVADFIDKIIEYTTILVNPDMFGLRATDFAEVLEKDLKIQIHRINRHDPEVERQIRRVTG